MIELIDVPSDKLIAYRTQGKITGDDFQKVAREIDQRLEAGAQDLRIYAEVGQIEGVEPDALVKDLKFGLSHMTELDRFGRMAVVTDSDWLTKAAKAEDVLLRPVDIETFPEADKERAMAWAMAEASA